MKVIQNRMLKDISGGNPLLVGVVAGLVTSAAWNLGRKGYEELKSSISTKRSSFKRKRN